MNDKKFSGMCPRFQICSGATVRQCGGRPNTHKFNSPEAGSKR